MTFLNPAVLLGLLAASIPIIIHLLNLRKLKKIDFSTLQFLKELQKNKKVFEDYTKEQDEWLAEIEKKYGV